MDPGQSKSKMEMKEIRKEVKQEAKQDAKKNVKKDVKQDMKRDVRKDVKQDMRKDVKQDMRKDVKRDVKVDTKNDAKKPQLIAQVDQKEGGVNTVIMNNYKCEKNDVPTTVGNGSTLPLVNASKQINEEEIGPHDPLQHRKLDHPTSDLDTFVHLLKGSLGSGILAMPMAFSNAGLALGLFCTFAIGMICTYCIHILVKSAHALCRRTKVPSLGFAEVAEAAFLTGPSGVRPWSRFAKSMINLFLVIDLLGCCCVYVVFVAENIKQVVDFYIIDNFNKTQNATSYISQNMTHDQYPEELANQLLDKRIYMAALLPVLIAMNLIRNLKYLSPFSMFANVLIAVGLGITFYYVFTDLPPVSSQPLTVEASKLPKFFGTAIFALEGIGVVMPLENNMQTPTHFIGCPGVLNFGMFFVVMLYAITGFFGFLKYGSETKVGSITLNLPAHHILAQSVKIMIAVAVFFTYSLQFYVPMEIIWRALKHQFTKNQRLIEYSIRVGLVLLTVILAILIPNLGGFISLVGALCLSTLGLIFPAIVDMVTFYSKGWGRFNWRLWKNIFLMSFGFIGFLTGTYVSIIEITS